MFDLAAIQTALVEFGLDGWLLYDFRGGNVLARRVLELDQRPVTSRRFFYLVPAQGPPRKLVHRIEPGVLDHLPGDRAVYLRWQELEERLAELLAGMRRVAMEYSPGNAIPYISRVDAGTVEQVRARGVEVVSSGDLIQLFEAVWDDEQWDMHLQADRVTQSAYEVAWSLIAARCQQEGGSILETAVQAAIMEHFRRHELTTYSPPIVAVGPHAGDPHYEPGPGHDAPIRAGDFVLIDLWAKLDKPRAVYSDLTRVGYVGETVPDEYERIFQIVAEARNTAIARVRSAFEQGQPLAGWEVDRAARGVIEREGLGSAFIHRTGHSLGQEVHGNGANMDDLETHDERRILPRTAFTIEPGLYFEHFGVRSEVDVFIDAQRRVHVTGGLQDRVLAVLSQGS